MNENRERPTGCRTTESGRKEAPALLEETPKAQSVDTAKLVGARWVPTSLTEVYRTPRKATLESCVNSQRMTDWKCFTALRQARPLCRQRAGIRTSEVVARSLMIARESMRGRERYVGIHSPTHYSTRKTTRPVNSQGSSEVFKT